MKDFFVIEGVDGSGKTTLAKRLASWLSSQGIPNELVHNPSSTQLGLEIGDRLKNFNRHSDLVKASLFMAAHFELLDQYILPALAKGKIVICDRYLPSTLIYQFDAMILNKTLPIWMLDCCDALCIATTKMPRPEAYFILKCRCDAIAGRRPIQAMDNLEYDVENMTRIANAYYNISTLTGSKVYSLDATATPDEVFEDAKNRLRLLVGSR